MDALSGREPFIMIADGKSALFAPSGMKDGPLPTHYEPLESPIQTPLWPAVEPGGEALGAGGQSLAPLGDPRFPYAFTTYRLTEHHFGGHADPLVPVTAELQPEGFAEIPTELARENWASTTSTGW